LHLSDLFNIYKKRSICTCVYIKHTYIIYIYISWDHYNSIIIITTFVTITFYSWRGFEVGSKRLTDCKNKLDNFHKSEFLETSKLLNYLQKKESISNIYYNDFLDFNYISCLRDWKRDQASSRNRGDMASFPLAWIE